jgi:hypothetical protein
MRYGWIWGVLCVLGAPALAAPESGDIFREYVWAGPWVNASRWQRVTGPDAAPERAKAHLPNPVNRIQIDDLDKGRKAGVYIEMLLCHGGTINKRVRVNQNAWIGIPESPYIPGEAGTGPPDAECQYMHYPCVEILKQLRQGDNTFEFTCSGRTSLGGRWPQWIVYGVTFRIYYDDTKPHVKGTILTPRSGGRLGDVPVIECQTTLDADVNHVDVIGLYEDFDWDGDGLYHQWHYRYRYGKMKSHIGTVTSSPWKATWDNTWVPTQKGPMALTARVVDRTGMCYMTPMVRELYLCRKKTVRMCKPYKVPKRWSARAREMHYCKADINDDLDKLIAAQITMCTWNGYAGDVIGINGRKVVTQVGKNHDLSYDSFAVPIEFVLPETNTLYTYSDTHHHGLEVKWPGMVLFLRYDEPEQIPASRWWTQNGCLTWWMYIF